jgi:hypothetical protein
MNRYFWSILLALFFSWGSAQDRIIKTTGDTVRAKVLEIGTNAISYKKSNLPDGPTFTVMKSDILMVILADGTIEYMSQNKNDLSKENGNSSLDQSANNSQATNSSSFSQDQKNKIELSDGKYYINGEKASRKQVNKMLGSSKNPAIIIPLKAAKATGTAQKIVKITSIPTTIGGSTALLVSGIDLINDIRRTRDHTSTYTSFFTSVFTTFSLPITNKILKKKSDKMYGKLIDIYNVTN